MSLRNNSVLPLEYFSKRAHEILALINQKPDGTRKEIAKYLGLGVNQVTHPILGLLREGFIVESGQTNESWPSATLTITEEGINELKELGLLKANTASVVAQTPTPVPSKPSLLSYISRTPKADTAASSVKQTDIVNKAPTISASPSVTETAFNKREIILPKDTSTPNDSFGLTVDVGGYRISVVKIKD